MKRCEKCKAWVYEGNTTLMGNPHKCAPEYEVINEWDKGDWDEAIIVHAYDYDDAATKAAEDFDSSCGEGASERILDVRKVGEPEIKRFNISFDYSVDYHANETNQTKGSGA
jgi:hypothetical protein